MISSSPSFSKSLAVDNMLTRPRPLRRPQAAADQLYMYNARARIADILVNWNWNWNWNCGVLSANYQTDFILQYLQCRWAYTSEISGRQKWHSPGGSIFPREMTSWPPS